MKPLLTAHIATTSGTLPALDLASGTPECRTTASSTLPVPEGVPESVWARLARPEGRRWAISERDGRGEVIGISYRDAQGQKTFKTGARRGLIIPWPLAGYAGTSKAEPVFVGEGASDTAALLGLGFDAVGVPMAGQGGEMLAELLGGRHAVIVADADETGRRGASKISEAMRGRCASVRVIEPPGGAKDARAAVIAGAKAEAFMILARAATVQSEASATIKEGPVLVRLSDVKPEQVDWLWFGRIALGKVTLFAGDPGLGKSFLTVDIAARVSRGLAWPDAPGVATTPGGVVLLNAEDGVADTIRPRLDAAGADVDRIVALQAIRSVGVNGRELDRAFDLSCDLPALERAIRSVDGCRLVVIDPVTAYLGGVDSHKNAEVRGLLAPLSTIAEKFGVAVLAVTHLNKAGGGPAIYRAMGSLAFTAAARAAWVVTKDHDDPQRRLLLPIKNNIAPDTGVLAYRITPTGVDGCPVVAWESVPVHVTADEALAGSGHQAGGRAKRDDATDWLAALLAHGPRLSCDVERDARAAGHTLATLKRAKEDVGVVARKVGFRGPWEWALPVPAPALAEVAQPPDVVTEDAHSPSSEHLGEKRAEIDGIPPKGLNREGVSAFGDAERLGNTATAAGDPDAEYVLGERLGMADGLGMPTNPGSVAWLVAVGESEVSR